MSTNKQLSLSQPGTVIGFCWSRFLFKFNNHWHCPILLFRPLQNAGMPFAGNSKMNRSVVVALACRWVVKGAKSLRKICLKPEKILSKNALLSPTPYSQPENLNLKSGPDLQVRP